jgi:hypothetical protein
MLIILLWQGLRSEINILLQKRGMCDVLWKHKLTFNWIISNSYFRWHQKCIKITKVLNCETSWKLNKNKTSTFLILLPILITNLLTLNQILHTAHEPMFRKPSPCLTVVLNGQCEKCTSTFLKAQSSHHSNKATLR